MLANFGIIALLALYIADRGYQPILNKHIEVSVNRAEAQIRYLRLELSIELLGGGVGDRATQCVIN